MGRETTGALVLEDNSGTWSSVTLPTGLVSGVTGIGCLSTSECVLSGFGPSGGVLVSLNPSTGTTVQIPLPGGVTATDLTSVTCPASGTTCVVTGTNGGTAGVLLSTNGASAASVLPATGTTTVLTLSGSSCPTTTQCFAVGSGTSGGGPVGTVLTGSGSTWALQTGVPNSVTAINSVSCSGTTPFMCTASVNSGGTTLLSTTNAGATWSLPTTLPTNGRIGPISCVGTTSCFASLEVVSGTTTTGEIVASTDGGVTWAVPGSFPTGVGAITGLSCSSATQCVFVGSSSSGAAAGSLSGTTWSSTTLPGSNTFASGVACDSSTHCIATGESPTGPIAYTSSTYGSSWSQANGSAPAGIGTLTNTGLTASGLPLTYTNVQLGGTNVGVPYSTSTATDPTTVGNLFPFVGATGATYSVWAGDCTPADQPSSSYLGSTAVQAGQYAPSSSSSLTVPLSYLALRLAYPNGTPVSGATVTATVTTSSCNADVFALPSSQQDGLVEAGLPLGTAATPLTYTITATSGANTATAQISMSPSGVTVGGVTYPYPIPVPVTIP
jgi:hypothetical protein